MDIEKTLTPQQLEFNFEVIALGPAKESCGCGGNRSGCSKTDAASDDSEGCPGCGGTLRRFRTCLVCDRCGYRACE